MKRRTSGGATNYVTHSPTQQQMAIITQHLCVLGKTFFCKFQRKFFFYLWSFEEKNIK